MGIVGNGVCKFGPSFGFQDHPNVTVAAVSDLFPDRCSEMAKVCRCEKTYPSLEELVKDDTLEAVFVATDAPSHARHCIEVLKHGKHVASAVPAVFGSLEDAHKLFETVKSSGKKYMMFETSAFHEDCYAMRQIYRAGGFGKLVYTEGEYFHYMPEADPVVSGIGGSGFRRNGIPRTRTAYYVCVTGGSFTEVSCMGMPSVSSTCSRRTTATRTRSAPRSPCSGRARAEWPAWPSVGTRPGYERRMGRVLGQRGFDAGMTYSGLEKKLPDLECPPLPPTVAPGTTAARPAT